MVNIYIVAEIGINSNGSIELTKELIDKAAQAGCNAVKLQKRTIDLVYSEEELNKPRESPWGNTTRDQKNGLEFSIEQHQIIQEYSVSKNLNYFVSCWDINSIELVEKYLNVKYHKVASALLTDTSFLEKINSTNKPVILSTGMSTPQEIDAAVKKLKNLEYILACTSTYPTKDNEINLNYITTLKNLYPQHKIGFSNHHSGLMACYGAAALGAQYIEFHITKDRSMYGSDQAASIENCDDLVSGIRKMSILLGDGQKKVYESEKSIIQKLRKINDILF